MSNTLFDLLPIFAGLLVAVTIYRASSVGIQAVNEFRMRLRRIEIVRTYQIAGKASVKNVSKQVNTAKLIVGAYGDRLVKSAYRTKLERLLVNSGDWENKKYATLVQRKMLFAIVGFFMGFFFLLIRNIQLVPIFVVVVSVAYFLPDVERFLQRVSGIKYRNKLEHLLDQAGNWKESDYFSLIRRKIIFALNSFVVSYLYLIAKDKSYGSLLFSIFAIFMGFFLPDILLQNRVLKRKEMLADTLPDAIDMLQMCVSAGLAFPAALSKVADTQKGPVAEEFARVTAEVQLGQSRSDALAAMAERTQEEHIQKFVSAMMQVDRFGIPVGNVLTEQSKEMRSARRERARERGQKVPVKILAPIMLCFLPTVLMIILGPAVISIMRAFGGQ